MTIKKLTYIGLALCVAVLSGCSDDIATSNTLSGDGTKTPLTVTALLDANGKVSQTRAADKTFDETNGDELKVMLRHVTWTGKLQKDQGYVENTDAPKPLSSPISNLVTFTAKGVAEYKETDNDILPFDTRDIGIDPSTTNQAATLTANPKLYWDDFSIGGGEDNTNIRKIGHYLQSFYGYCYNGGTPSTSLTEETGVLGWSVATDQTSGFKTSDLLWSPAQKPVEYTHATSQTENHGQVVIPFLHAMSKVTINVTAGEGFKDNYDFTTGNNNTSVTLKDVRVKCTAEAPTATLTPTAGAKDNVTMKPGTGEGTRSFEAIIVPSILTVGNTFATITNMDGDTYNIPVTEAMIAEKDDKTGWGNQLDNADEDVDNGTAQAKPMTRTDAQVPGGKGHQMRSGVHYVLNVTINKTGINVSATILDWDEVFAEGVGEIHFDNDVTDKNGSIEALLQNYGIDVYQSADNTNFGTRATHMRYNKTTGKWKYDPVIYWQGGKAQYFRALSNARNDVSTTTDVNESLIMENARDVLWGTTQEKNGYAESAAVNPRTGDVPLKFYHAMSMITFYLEDALKGNTDDASHIDLNGATIQLTNLATGGTLNLNTGLIESGTSSQKTFSEDPGAVPARMGYFAAKENGSSTESKYDPEYTLKDYVITPQTIGDDAQVIVTLADGTVYKAQLNLCTREVNGVPTAFNTWERGNHYKYTITLGKETITFRAMIEPWNHVDGGGKATLEWD